jgi:hypothetical protein
VTRLRLPLVLSFLIVVTACAAIPQRPPRLEGSSHECIAAAIRQKLPANLSDEHAHCVASGLIARYCSVSEAHLAGIGKEFRDLFTRGDASWADWRADRLGIGCARRTNDDQALVACCQP